MINFAIDTNRCRKITLGTNGVLLPFIYRDTKLDILESINSLFLYFKDITIPFTLKPSINYHLIKNDKDHIEKMTILKETFEKLSKIGDYSLTFNVRRRKDKKTEDEKWIIDLLDKKRLTKLSNIFYYQRYGKAKDNEEFEVPFIIKNPVDFYLISPDGKNWGTDLIARSDHMRGLK